MTLRRPKNYRRLLGWANYKTEKGESFGYFTGILYLSPSTESGVMNTCGSASPECIKACLKSSGRMPMGVKARIDKTRLLVANRALFLDCLRHDIRTTIRRAAALGLKPAVRVNGTSDLPWIPMLLSAEFPEVQFYDYTKHKRPYLRARANYAITFSYSGHNLTDALDALANGVNVAVVFDTRRGMPLPETWNGRQVIDGDKHDLRFLDPAGVVVGLRAKGKAIGADCAFVVKSKPELIQIGRAA
jgi:hypothetical protein